MISTSSILSTGLKKWMPMNCSGRGVVRARSLIGRVEVLVAKTASAGIAASAFLRDLGLDGGVLEHRLDDQVAAGEGCVVGRRRDAGKHLGLFLLSVDLRRLTLVQQAGRIGLAAFGGVLGGVDQHYLDPGHGADIGDARAHHAGAQDAQFFHALVRGLGAVRALFQRLLVDEEAADHRGRAGVHQHIGKPARLDLQRGVKGTSAPS